MVDHLFLVERIDRLRERVIVRVPCPADRSRNSGIDESFRISDRGILHAPVAVMDESFAEFLPAGPQCHFQSIESEFGTQRVGHLPAHDGAGEGIGDERGVADPPLPSSWLFDQGAAVARPGMT